MFCFAHSFISLQMITTTEMINSKSCVHIKPPSTTHWYIGMLSTCQLWEIFGHVVFSVWNVYLNLHNKTVLASKSCQPLSKWVIKIASIFTRPAGYKHTKKWRSQTKQNSHKHHLLMIAFTCYSVQAKCCIRAWRNKLTLRVFNKIATPVGREMHISQYLVDYW